MAPPWSKTRLAFRGTTALLIALLASFVQAFQIPFSKAPSSLLKASSYLLPSARPLPRQPHIDYARLFDVQAHRGGRGHVVESILPTFAYGLMIGATTIELDIVLSKDDEVIVWHDEDISPLKCRDTRPVFPDDPLFPYADGQKYVANLTLAQLKTLDCGSVRLADFPLQLQYPGSKIPTLEEFFAFLDCATDAPVLLNVETKIMPLAPHTTRSARDLILTALPILVASGRIPQMTLQSFDWEILVQAKKIMPELRTAALADDTTIWEDQTGRRGRSAYLGGVNLDAFEGTEGERLVLAAASINASVISPSSETSYSPPSPLDPKFVEFTTPDLLAKARELGLEVIVWTVNDLTRVQQLYDRGIRGIVSDYPATVRSWLEQTAKESVPPLGDTERINRCLAVHNQYALI